MIHFINPYRFGGVSIPSFTFQTEFEVTADGTFSPTLTTINGETVTWTLIEGYNETTNSLSKADRTGLGTTELDGTCQDVVVTFSTGDPLNITELFMGQEHICDELNLSLFEGATTIKFNDNEIDEVTLPSSTALVVITNFSNNNLTSLDLSVLEDIGGSIRYNGNSGLTTVTNATASGELITDYRGFSCALTGIDLSGYSRLGGNVLIYDNDATTITFPSSSETFTMLRIDQNNLTTIDFSPLSGFGSDIRFYSNPSANSVTFPTSTEVITRLWGRSSNYSTVDFSTLSKLGGDFRFNANSGMTSITLPTTSQNFSFFNVQDCDMGFIDFTKLTGTNNAISIDLTNNSMTATEVNHILVDIDNEGWTNITLKMAGTNAAPDGTSGGFDGLTAKANIITAGGTVTTN